VARMTRFPARRSLHLLILAALLGSAVSDVARAEAGWFESGDVALRMDLQLLNDAEIIRLPVNQWPLPRAAVRYAIGNAKEHFATNSAVAAALARVRARLEPPGRARLSVVARAGEPGLFHEFGTSFRENGELGARAGYDGERFAAALALTAAASPADGQALRADGSHATVQLGNWLLSANTLERYWGPSQESSLILSNNARPMPTLMVERAAAIPFESPWLSWLGPWRLNFAVSRMESQRQDIDAPLFMAWRVAIMPFKKIELGFSRTAQFCGKQLECNLSVFGNLLAGNDNVGIDATRANEPGNQMAGFDIRWNSPIGTLPYAVYSQMIGEDESGYLPAKYLEQFGIETWKPLGDGGLIQAFFEYASTTCSANTSRGPYYNCAYNQGRFNIEGYRYLGRVIGFTSDRDAENWAVGANFIEVDGTLWSLTARTAVLNRDGDLDIHDTVSSVRANYSALEMGWKARVRDEEFRVDLGVESLEPVDRDRKVDVFGFVGWRHFFK
jgi:hypothetical protein